LNAKLVLAFCLVSAAAHAADSMTIARHGTQQVGKGPERYFTGAVTVEPLYQPKAPARYSAAYVTFEPAARSAWHSHPLGQTLVVTAGTGWVQEEGGAKLEIKPGDVIWTPPGVKHWHGATSSAAMTHMAITEARDGKNVDWMEKVTDAQYNR
jgi:quercetin dioxygenase-like cupin family protein